jgi:RNA polymerase sigma-70 factor (ECF subfamily)
LGTNCSAFFVDVYEQHGTPLLRYASRMLGGDWYRAEDILQETAARAWRHREHLATVQDPRPWLFTVARRLVIDHRRALRVRPAEVPAADQPELPMTDDIDRTLTSQVVLEALRDLSDQHREVIQLVHYFGYSVAQASDHLGIPPGTVKSRSYYALRALKEALISRGTDGLEGLRPGSAGPSGSHASRRG